MKQQPEAIQRIRQSTHNTIKNIKNSFNQESLKLEGAVFDMMFSECFDSLESLILNLIGDLGSEYLRITKSLMTVGSSVLELKGENKQLHEQLSKAHHLIAEKNAKIQALQANNNILTQTIAILQNLVNQYEQNEQQSLDSVENLEQGDIQSYASEESCIESEIEELCQLDNQN